MHRFLLEKYFFQRQSLRSWWVWNSCIPYATRNHDLWPNRSRLWCLRGFSLLQIGSLQTRYRRPSGRPCDQNHGLGNRKWRGLLVSLKLQQPVNIFCVKIVQCHTYVIILTLIQARYELMEFWLGRSWNFQNFSRQRWVRNRRRILRSKS